MSYPEEVRLKAQDSKPITPTQIILHSLGNGYNFDAGVEWLRDPSNPLEAHIAVRKDGYRVQLVPYTMRAEANYHANRRPDGTGALSVETDSSVAAEEPWSDDQVASIIEWCATRCKEFDIPPRLCRTPDDPGIGWHIMFGSPGEWTPARKVCPGPARIEQVKNIILPGIQKALFTPIVSPSTPSTPSTPTAPEADVTPDQIKSAVVAALNSDAGQQALQVALDRRLNAQFGHADDPKSILNTGFGRRVRAEVRAALRDFLGGKK